MHAGDESTPVYALRSQNLASDLEYILGSISLPSPSTEPGPALDRPVTALEGSAARRPNNAAVFTYEDENPLQEM